MGVSVFAAMDEDGIAISMGDDAEDRVTDVLNADVIEPTPVFSMAMDAGRYYEMIADSMMVDPNDDLPEETREALRDTLLVVGDIYDRMSLDMRFTENGVEFSTVVTIAQ